MGKNVHVTKSKDGSGWSTKTEKSKRAYKVTSTQKEAIEVGKKIAKNNNSELLIHGKNGKIREKNSYGNDNFPPKG